LPESCCGGCVSRDAEADQLRKKAWVQRSFTLSTLNYLSRQSLARTWINYSPPGIGFSSEKVSDRLLPDKSLTGGYNFTVNTITEIQEAIDKLAS
jgi:hypothetical protein